MDADVLVVGLVEVEVDIVVGLMVEVEELEELDLVDDVDLIADEEAEDGARARILAAACSPTATMRELGLVEGIPGKMEASTTNMLSVP